MLYPIQNESRNRLDISGIWDFRVDPEGRGLAEGWNRGLTESRPIAVPGSWNEQYADLHAYLGLGWYATSTRIPSTWKSQRIWIRVGSANYHGTVFINGEEAGSHEGGHLPFAFDITELVDWESSNSVVIAVENELRPDRVPSGNIANTSMGMMAGSPATTFDFYPFAGIHRPVILYSTPKVFINSCKVETGLAGQKGSVRVSVRLNEPLTTAGETGLRDREGVLVATAPLDFSAGRAEAVLEVGKAHPWSDIDPYLYSLSIGIQGDRYELDVGIRTIEVREGMILLNGEPVRLKGFGRHEDFPASGRGLNLPLMVKDYHLMRWVGANSYRTSHYPYSEEEMRLADREGFLVIDEVPAVSLQFDNEANMAERLRVCLGQIEELIERDRNHPAVVMWSVANEPMPANLDLAGAARNGGDEDAAAKPGKAFLDTLLSKAKALDPGRPVTIVTVMGGPASWMENCDVICMNRYWGWYVLGGQLELAFSQLEGELDSVWEKWRKPLIMTEFGADTMAGMHGQPDLMWTEEYQASLLRGYLKVAGRKPWVAGMQVWNFADFAAVQSVLRVGGLNMKGVFTRTRAPKLAAYALREAWTGERVFD